MPGIRQLDHEEDPMAGKADFTEEEWEQLRKGATGAGLLVSASDRSFFDSFKEAGSLAKHLAGGKSGDSQLVRELAGERGSGFGVRSSQEELESGTFEALRSSVATLRQKAPDELDAYRAFVLDVADRVGKAAGGGEEAEAATLGKIKQALS
jgi:hypothetical protein